MNYRHSYHAGGFADVLKHSILTVVIDYLKQKEAAFCYFDTHSGLGLYDLSHSHSQKTQEAADGVIKLINYQHEHPATLQCYLNLLKDYQQHEQLLFYPGSPMIVYNLLRPQDRMIINELHPEDFKLLQSNFKNNPQVMTHQRDAYEFLPAMLPPTQKRGVVLIDPAFENKAEHDFLKICLAKALKRWPQATYIIWYPVTAHARWNIKSLVPVSHKDQYIIVELTITAARAKGLVGSDLLIINPPWILNNLLPPLLQHLWEVLNINGEGDWRIENC